MIAPSELIINPDGSCFHLHLKPEQLADKIIMVGDPDRVNTVASYFDTKECEVSSREFHTITGTYKGKRITTLSHGIGTDNIDIVLNELDALANIDFASRTIKPIFRQLTMVRVGTSGGLQPFVPVGTYVAAGKSIGFDGVLYFYADSEKVRDKAFESELMRQLKWKLSGIQPYIVSADPSLVMARCPIKADSPARDELSISKLVIRLSLNSKASILRFSSGSASGKRSLRPCGP